MKKLLLKLAELAVNGSKHAWKITDGKKTIAGLIITGVGTGLMFIPGGQGYGTDLIITGVPILATGIFHKYKKYKEKKGK
jgi:hypothetical protein